MQPEHAELKDWKAKYGELLAELEAKERAWSDLETALRKVGTQLAIAALGQSKALDAILDSLLAQLRGDTDPRALTGLLERLSRTVRRIESDLSESQRVAQRVTDPDAEIARLLGALAQNIVQVSHEPDAGEDFQRLLANHQKSRDWEALCQGLADHVAETIGSIQAQKQELKEFLEQVTEQLAQFEAWTNWQQDDAKARQETSADLEHTVKHEMQGLLEAVDSTPSLSELKRKVQDRLDAVAARLRKFRETEQASLAEVQQRNNALKQELGHLRQRTTQLAKLADSRQQRLMIDALTQLHSRHAYDQRLQEEFHRWQRHGQPLTYAIWDIDRFKSVNDRFGHRAGDRLLQMIGKVFNSGRRREDFVARIGGEEFVSLLPSTDLAAALQMVERLRERIASTPFHHHGTPEQVTVSCGLTELRDGDTPESIYERADQALYTAKKEGRNRCVSV